MNKLTQEELLLQAQCQFNEMLHAIGQHWQDGTRIDLVERDIFRRMLEASRSALAGSIAGAGDGDEGKCVEVDGRTLQRSDRPHRRMYHSNFGELEIDRYVYAPGPRRKLPTRRSTPGWDFLAENIRICWKIGSSGYVSRNRLRKERPIWRPF